LQGVEGEIGHHRRGVRAGVQQRVHGVDSVCANGKLERRCAAFGAVTKMHSWRRHVERCAVRDQKLEHCRSRLLGGYSLVQDAWQAFEAVDAKALHKLMKHATMMRPDDAAASSAFVLCSLFHGCS
jgi:hypothetical protein